MSEFAPVTTMADLDALDLDEMRAGYWDGFQGEPEPGNNRTRSYWHGWCNGAVDKGLREKTQEQAELARLCVAEARRTLLKETAAGPGEGRSK